MDKNLQKNDGKKMIIKSICEHLMLEAYNLYAFLNIIGTISNIILI